MAQIKIKQNKNSAVAFNLTKTVSFSYSYELRMCLLQTGFTFQETGLVTFLVINIGTV